MGTGEKLLTVTLQWTSIQSRGYISIPSCFALQKLRQALAAWVSSMWDIARVHFSIKFPMYLLSFLSNQNKLDKSISVLLSGDLNRLLLCSQKLFFDGMFFTTTSCFEINYQGE